jgi:hypothetical protein
VSPSHAQVELLRLAHGYERAASARADADAAFATDLRTLAAGLSDPPTPPTMNRSFRHPLILALFSLLAVVAAGAAIAGGPLPRIESVDSDGTRHVYVPATQPADTEALPRIEVFDLEGLRSVFVPQQPPETLDVVEQTIARAAAERRKLTEAELQACEQYALSRGAYAPPAGVPLTTIQPGADLTRLAPGHYWAAPGVYPFPSGRVVARVYATKRGSCTFAGRTGQQCRIEFGGGLYGFVGTGAGLKDRLNDNAAVLVGDNCDYIGGSWSKALGVAIAGGQYRKDSSGKLKLSNAAHARVLGNLVEDNGSGAVGGKFTDGEIAYNVCHRNNLTVGDSDGGLVGKLSRCVRVRVHHNVARSGQNAGIWPDIGNGPGEITDNIICDVRLNSPKKPWTGVGIKTEIGLPGWRILRNYIVGTASYCIDVNETYDVEVGGNVLEESPPSRDGGVLGLRNLRRSDAPGSPPHAWTLGEIDVHDNVMLKGYGTITGSSTGDRLTLTGFGITVHDNVGESRYANIKP